MKKEYEQHYITSKQVEDMEDTSGLFAVFEEDSDKPKMYDLTKGIFDDFETAKEYAEAIHDKEDIFVANYNDYVNGNYNYLHEVR